MCNVGLFFGRACTCAMDCIALSLQLWTLARSSTLSVAFDVLCVGLVMEVALGLGWFDVSVFCCVVPLLHCFLVLVSSVLVIPLIR